MVPDTEGPQMNDVVPDPVTGTPVSDAVAATDPQANPRSLTPRERRRRIILLAILLLLLALLSYASYYVWQNRQAPTLSVRPLGQDAVVPPQFLYAIAGEGVNELDRPIGVGVAADGRVYVVDFGNRRISVFTNGGRYLFSFGDKAGAGQLRNPVHLVIKGDEVWVSDRRRQELVIYGLDGTFKRVFEPKGEDIEWTPLAFGFSRDGKLVVSDVFDTDRHRLHYFSADGSRTATVGETAQVIMADEEPLGFMFPNGIAIADDGNVYVSDGDNRRVQVLTPQATFKQFMNTSGLPRGIAIDAQQRVYVADALAHTVDVYDLKGKAITQFGERGFGPGQFNFPNDVAIDRRGRIYISDRENDQVQVWGWQAAATPPIPVPSTSAGWAACIAPLLLLPLLLLLRKRRVVVTPDFVEALGIAGELKAVEQKRRLRLVAPEEDKPLYAGRVVDDVDLEKLLTFEAHSESDAKAIADKYRFGERESMLIAMAQQARALATMDVELRRMAIYSETRVVDLQEFREIFLGRRDKPSAE